MSVFIDGAPHINLFSETEGKQDLYANQIAAVGAVIAHFSTKSQPALVTMPTGTGKTAVMILLSYALKGKKVLVITPSQLVRAQIANQFRNPELLVSKCIINKEYLPKVYEVIGEINDPLEWKKTCDENDVIVGIPGTLTKIPTPADPVDNVEFDLLFVDEAHHSRASSWQEILNRYISAKQVLLTATPFRRDKKDIKARLVYSYPLKQAYENKLFSRIDFVPVMTNDHDSQDDKNIAIAKKAAEIYKQRTNDEHKIIIRTDSRTAANKLNAIYKEHTDLVLEVIHSKLSEKFIRSRISKLRSGKIDGVICVNMMGEGYDFPALKIAAVHVPHKSLAITLQFVGRISRTNIEDGNVAKVVAGQHEFEIESYQLFKNDTKDWSIVLPDLHKAKIQKTEDEQDFFDSFEDLTEPTPLFDYDIEELLQVDNDDLKPFFHVKAYQIIPPAENALFEAENAEELIDISVEIDFNGTSLLKNPLVRHHQVSNEFDVAVFIVSELKTPAWYQKDDQLKDVKNELVIVYFNRDNRLLYICSTIKENELYEHIVEQYLLTGVLHDKIPLPYLKRVMAGWKETKLYNVGMKSRKTKGNTESYKNILGSQAQKSVLPTDKYSYTRGHSFGGGFEPLLGKEMMVGISPASKIWTLEDNKIKYLTGWLDFLSKKIGDPEMDNLHAPLSELDSGKVVDQFADKEVFFADWAPGFYHKLTSVYFLNEHGEPAESALVCSCDIHVIEKLKDLICLQISKNDHHAKIYYSLKPKICFNYHPETEHTLAIKRGESFTTDKAFLTLLAEDPIHLYYEDLSKQDGRVFYEFGKEIGTIEEKKLIRHNWPKEVNLKKEFFSRDDIERNKLQNDNRISIHEYIIEEAKKIYDVVFYDHGSLEIADVIGFKKGKVQFFHCKKQSGEVPNCSINDNYEVAGQATKSVNWANRKLLLNQIYERADKNDSHRKLKKGTLDEIKEILGAFTSPVIPVEITIVQPGLKTKNLSVQQEEAFKRIKILLSSSEAFLKDVSSCELSVWTS
ncbi:DEAD/DEAH box helicase [Sphingobacterium sp. FBM7-1]|uniref:DEAD/DEAH box helicase n=1 Tax=Sphingobacterium sp. FBM7-1 TaxID=2886688 RepID=UPI001D128ACB|nr:DEAD/DEAH box helicase family protein [Sphingobacterium sp. FBM7-1]MCC2598424.1 DEAD/DEAH box helicase family protein [Sphingobacterium sp. FBM7-1]